MADFSELVDWCAANRTTHLAASIDGELVVDESWGFAPDEPHDVGSIQKLLTGVVLAQLLTKEAVRLDQPVNEIIGPGWSDASAEHESAVTISHLATMTAGLDDDFRPIHEPGTGWYYCNNGYHLLRRALEDVDGRDTDAVFRARIFDSCDMENSSFALRDPSDPGSLPALVTTGRDIIRFGAALLQPEPFGIDGGMITHLRTATDSNPFYGHLCWLYRGRSGTVTGHAEGQQPISGRRFGGIQLDRPIAAAIPVDGFGGTGLGDQRLIMVPSQRLVITRLGRPIGAEPGSVDRELWQRVPHEFHAP